MPKSSFESEREVDYAEWHCSREDCGDQLLERKVYRKLDEDRHYVACVCPNCGDPKRGVYSSELVGVLDDEIEYAQECMLEDLKDAKEMFMREWATEFIAQLTNDVITPDSFSS